ncbi:MAG: FkbM family methyltransferase [Nostocaceae cyanobacterium]|nr:FkbM family methyltransferase [Nostocaceae cyanobacterium]
MKIEKKLINTLPNSWNLPVKYHYRKIRNRLEKELSYLDKIVGNGKRAIDIGANEGIYSYALAQICQIVEVFEPQSWCTEAIVNYNRIHRNINIYNVALSDFNGSLTLNVPTSNGDYSHQVSGLGKLTTGLATFGELEGETISIDVPVRKLDDYNFQDVSLIKIDVEGHESRVIDGARETILREKPILIVEIEQKHIKDKPIDHVFEQITGLGYTGYFLYQSSLTPISEFSCENHQNSASNTRQNHEFINNFIFKPISEAI